MEQRRREACDEVDNIRVHGGGITPEDIDFMRQGRPLLLQSFLNLQQQVATSAKLLADQLNTKDAHFVYELIQNAADNEYPKTVEPCLEMTLEDGRIIIDSNEVGFSGEDIKAISRIAQSTKKNKIGFVGEKGIGFKSVFKVARKVHIQSEPYSFAFTHEDNDSGLGMVTPINEGHLHIPVGVQTRMILHLRDKYTGAGLCPDFLKLPATSLLFLRNLEKITLNIRVFELPEQRITFSAKQIDVPKASNQFMIRKDDGITISKSIFWLKKRQLDDMPPHPARKGTKQAEVILAFPVDRESVPVVESQWISAFLPLRVEKFKFLIQSDFITNANREDVLECKWNDRLRDVVAETFLLAVEDDDGFLNHPTLRYSWVRYIPATSMAHEYWGKLQRKIVYKLKKRRLFISQQEDDEKSDNRGKVKEFARWTADELRIVSKQYRDDNGDPLLPDLVDDAIAYVSEKYDQNLDLPILRKLGTIKLCAIPDFLDRLSQDLDRDEKSMWRTKPFSSDWYTRVSNLLLGAIENSRGKELVQKLEIIPLKNSKWVTSFKASIFFPTLDGINIPEGLLLALLDGDALNNQTFRSLVGKLGVKNCGLHHIIDLIEKRYKRDASIRPKTVVSDIQFLFWHHKSVPLLDYNIYLSCNHLAGFSWSDVDEGGWLYRPELDHPYSMYKLLNGEIPTELHSKIRFPRIEIFNALESLAPRYNMTGIDWLMSRAAIKSTPMLQRRTRSSRLGSRIVEMSAELLYIRENLPQWLLGVLEMDWNNYHESKDWDEVIQTAKVPILDAREERELKTTFLPLSSLKKIASQLDLSEEFGFLEELDEMADIDTGKWQFLKRFGVGIKEDLRFWLALLRKAREKEDIKKDHIFEIYKHLQKFVDEEDSVTIREAFREEELTYLPVLTSLGPWEWYRVKYCIWNAPEWFLYRTPLNNLSDYQSLYGLFVRTLQVKDLSIENCLDNLEFIKEGGYEREEEIEEEEESNADAEEGDALICLLYRKLGELVETERDANAAKDKVSCKMQEEELVYDPKERTWYSPTACIWAEDRIQLPGKFSIATVYKDQTSFFSNVLGVKKPDLRMHIVALVQKSSISPEKESILQEMRNICALDPDSKTLQTSLRDCACFPVRKPSGEIEWSSPGQRFAIVDRTEYGIMFGNIVDTLDFSLEEVHSVRVLLIGLNLERRYLSNAIEEESRVEEYTADVVLTENMRRKAYAITRYAVHLGASNPTAIFSLLQELEIFTSDKIFRTVSVFQKPITDKAFFHMEKEDGKLRLYIPQNREHQQVCLLRHLPSKLLKHLGATERGKGSELGGVIMASSLSVVDYMLEQDGVIDILGVAKPDDVNNVSLALSWTSFAQPVTATSMMRSEVQQPSAQPDAVYQIEDPVFTDDSSWTPPNFGHYEPPETEGPPEHPELFSKLIDFVIHQSNHIDALPIFGTYIESSQVYEEYFDHRLAIDSEFPGTGRQKIGALGELLVYRLLKSLGLPGFSTQCWQSTIRHLVSIHDLYTRFTQWTGEETTDLVYVDSESKLTDHLIRSGYLARSLWHGCTPTYYIEVKTTMGGVDYPFFCSQKQFDRMERMELPDSDESADEVYLIARAFGLGQSRMGLKLYLDPWNLRRTQCLKFEAKLYTVTSPQSIS